MDQEPDVIRQQIDDTRSSLTDKIETLESTVRATIEDAKETVEGTIENVKVTVEDTIQNVKDSVSETVDTVKQSFDLCYQTEQRPWMMLGCSLAAGFVVGRLVEGQRHPRTWDLEGRGYHPTNHGTPQTQFRSEERPPSSNGHAQQAVSSTGSGWASQLLTQFQPEINMLKSIAIGAAFAVLRDVAKQSLPQLAPQIGELADSVTSKLGGEPIRQPMMSRSGSTV